VEPPLTSGSRQDRGPGGGYRVGMPLGMDVPGWAQTGLALASAATLIAVIVVLLRALRNRR
jgi:hypothetical protein